MNLIEDILTVYYVFEILQDFILVAHNTRFFRCSSRMVSCKYKNVDAVTAKAYHVTSNVECSRWYGSQKNFKMVCGEVISSLNKHRDTAGRRSWYVRARYDLGGGTMKIAQLNAHSIKEAPVIPQSGHVSLPTPPTIADIPLAAKVGAIIAPRISIVNPDICISAYTSSSSTRQYCNTTDRSRKLNN